MIYETVFNHLILCGGVFIRSPQRPSLSEPKLMKMDLDFVGPPSFDGFKGKYAGQCVFVEKQGMFVVRGDAPGIQQDLDFSANGVAMNFEVARHAQDVEVKFKNTEATTHGQLGGCSFASTFKVCSIESDSEGVFEVFLTLSAAPTEAQYSVFVELNMHNPEGPARYKPKNVMMFGETFHCAAVLALSPHVGVKVLQGDEKPKVAESQVRFLKSTAKCPDYVTTSVASVMGETGVKVRLDRITPFIAEALAEQDTFTTILQNAFTKQARGVCELAGEQLLTSALGLEVASWTGKAIAIFNRITTTNNNSHFDLSAAQISWLGKAVIAAGATRMLVFGDQLDDLQKEAVDSLALEFVDLTSYWKWEIFQECFGCNVDLSAQCYIQLTLQPYICLNLGPLSGGTDYLGFMGSNVINWTSTDHPAHPRMPRLIAQCHWWLCIPVGSTDEIKESRMENGFPKEHEHILYEAINGVIMRS